MKIKTILTAILAVSVVSATTVMMTGCGEQKGNASATATTAETTVARSTASSDKGGQSQDGGSQSNDSNSQSQENSAESSADSMSDDNSSNDIGISYDDAIANVKAQAGSGAQILSAVEGKSPDGYHCWVVTVSPVSKSDDSEKVTYYSGYLFCYADNYQDAQVSAENSEDNDNDEHSFKLLDNKIVHIGFLALNFNRAHQYSRGGIGDVGFYAVPVGELDRNCQALILVVGVGEHKR